MKQKKRKLTSNIVKASFVKNPRKELEANDGVDEDDEDDQQGDVKQGDHGHNDTVEHHLQTWKNVFVNTVIVFNRGNTRIRGF